MERVKVLRIITRLNIGGPAIHAVLLTSGFNDERFESQLVTGKLEPQESDMSYYAGKYAVTPLYIENMSREIRLGRDFAAFKELLKIIRHTKPNIVHTHTAKAGMLGRAAAIIGKVPVIIHTFHGNIFQGYFGKIKTSFFILIEKILAKFSTRIIAISSQQKKELLNFRIAKDSQIEVIKLGFQFQNVIPAETDKGVFRKEHNIPDKALLIGIIGRLVPIKNHKLFLSIAEEILKDHEDVYFAIIGDGELRKEIEREIELKRLSDRVFITGFIEDLRKVYADLDLVILTSCNEGTPVALIEAMACKKIVMSTRVGGVEDFINHGKNGYYFALQDREGFIKEIRNWLANPAQYKEIGQKAHESVIRDFSSQRLIDEIRKLYLNLMERS